MKLLIRKWVAVLLITSSILTFTLVPTRAFGMDGAAVVAAIMKVFVWLQGEMMDKLHQYQTEATNRIVNQLIDNFKQKLNWERWPASFKELTVEKMVPYENKFNAYAYKNAESYISYTQGSASGIDAAKYPVKTISNFNQDFNKVQEMNPDCKLQIPEAIGDTTQGCKPAQVAYTNAMLTGVNPLPTYPDNTLNTPIGQQYSIESKTNVTRTALSQLALDESTNQATNDFIELMQKSLQQPPLEQINAESSAAIARDSLILNQARAMLELRIYEVLLMNQRLLATVVAQNEDNHLNYIRRLGQNQSQALHR